MKMTNYRLQTEMEHINANNTEWFQDYLRQVLESDKPYYVKTDYIGLSIKELDNKIDYLSSDIKEMQALKKSLQNARSVALEVTASVLKEYGIDRLDGTAISSITITPPKTKTKETFKILDEDALVQLGFYKVVIDEQAVKDAMSTLEGMNTIDPYVEVGITQEKIPAKIKVNSRRNSTNNPSGELFTFGVSQEAA